MTIEEYLTDKLGAMAGADPNFSERYADPDKSMAECLAYITQEARKQTVNNCAVISDGDVLQMAVHYFQEKDVKPAAQPVALASAPATNTAVLVPDTKPRKKKAKEEDTRQLSLF